MPSPASAASSYSMFESLPLLVLETIYEYLADDDPQRRGVFAVSMTSKRCCAAIDRERFKRIIITTSSHRRLEDVIKGWNVILCRGARHRHVRRVKVAGCMSTGDDYKREDSATTSNQHTQDETLESEDNGDFDENGNDTMFQPLLLRPFVGSMPLVTQQYKVTSNKTWRALAQFLLNFHGLRDLVWASRDQLPRCILDALHQQLRNTRLHILTFSLRSLYQKRDKFHAIDTDEYALATSPSLYRIDTALTYVDSNGNVDFNREAVLRMVSGMAPNLRHVRMWHQVAEGTPEAREAASLLRPTLRGFSAESLSSQAKGNVMNLAFRGRSMLHQTCIQEWRQSTDFATLCSLDLCISIPRAVFQTLIDIATEGTFKNIRVLTLSDHLLKGQSEDEDQQVKELMVCNLLAALPPLEALTVLGRLRPMVQSTLNHHGASLQKLHLTNLLSCAEVANLRRYCPNIQDLRISVKRTQGDTQEVCLYQEPGSFPKLRCLTLLLDYFDDGITVGYGDAPSTRLKAERMRIALINSAIDERLAYDIFRVICQANQRARPGIVSPFRCLRLVIDRANLEEYPDFRMLQTWTCRQWKCERKHADLHSDEAWTEELAVRERRERRKQLTKCIEEGFKWYYRRDLFRPVWEAVWPESKGRDNWIDEWHSYPLKQNFDSMVE